MTHRVPDAVVLGEGSAGADSLALLNALRADATAADVPAVVLTGVQVPSGASTRDQHSGPTLLLQEPASAETVLAAVDDLTRATRHERVARRQLRRSLVALGATTRAVGTECGVGQAAAVIDRLHPPILGLDDHGSIVAASLGAERLLGYSRPELVAMTMFDTFFGPDLPLAALWQDYTEGRRGPTATVVRDRSGRQVPVEAAFDLLVPGLQALVLAPSLG
jgi:PAS domain S-box-containing protein